MSAFTVFGVTWEACMAAAIKSVECVVWESKRGVAFRRKMTGEEYETALREYAERMFQRQKNRPRQCSPLFDAPQFALDWIGLAARTSPDSSFTVMCRGVKVDEFDRIVRDKHGAPVEIWMPYENDAPKGKAR